MNTKELLDSAAKAAKQVEKEHHRFSVLCRFGWHAWTNWREVKRGQLKHKSGGLMGYYSHYKRHCKRCGHPQQKIINVT